MKGLEKRLVPELRFPEFNGEWKAISFKQLGEFGKTYSYSRNEEGIGNYYHIHYGDIHSKFNGIVKKDTEIPSITINKEHELLNNNDIVIADASEDYDDLGKTIVIKDTDGRKIVAGSHTFKFTPDRKLNSTFYMNYSKINSYKKFMRVNGTGVSVLGISKRNLSNMKINIPSIEEQTKIENFFTLIDNKIERQEEKVNNLEEYKNGMMQRIFNQEIRFKNENGEEYPNWEKKKIGEIFSERNQKGQGNLELLSITLKDGIIKRKDIEAKDNSRSDKSNYKVVDNRDIAYNSMRMWQGASGMSNYKGIVSPAYTVLIPNKDIYSQFFAYYFKTDKIINEFRKYSQGLTSDTWNLKYPLISNIKINLPSLNEQIKVAHFLVLLDEKLEKEEEKLKFIKEFKNGLMQKMFI